MDKNTQVYKARQKYATDGDNVTPVAIASESAAIKGRTPTAIGTTLKEIKFGLGDLISSVVMECDRTSGTTATGNYMLVCFDCSKAVAESLLGLDGATAPIESLDADIFVYHVSPEKNKKAEFSVPLSYAGNAGFKGNAWIKTLDNVNTLDGIFYGVDKS